MSKMTPAAVAELNEMRKVGKNLTPADILEQARSPNSALHGMFEWDDTEAARAYRIGQARVVARTYVRLADVQPRPVTHVTVRQAAVSSPRTPDTTAVAWSGETLAKFQLQAFLRDIQTVLDTYKGMNTPLVVRAHIDVAMALRKHGGGPETTPAIPPRPPFPPTRTAIAAPAPARVAPHPAQAFEKPYPKTLRCLGTCGGLFLSKHRGNRMCPACASKSG